MIKINAQSMGHLCVCVYYLCFVFVANFWFTREKEREDEELKTKSRFSIAKQNQTEKHHTNNWYFFFSSFLLFVFFFYLVL